MGLGLGLGGVSLVFCFVCVCEDCAGEDLIHVSGMMKQGWSSLLHSIWNVEEECGEGKEKKIKLSVAQGRVSAVLH